MALGWGDGMREGKYDGVLKVIKPEADDSMMQIV